jgi:hypothetical protein
MSNHTSRALRATVAAAGAATLGLSFVGTAAAADSHNLDDQDGSPSYGSDSPDSVLSQDSNTPSVDNELLSFETPRVETASYWTPLGGYTASHDGWGYGDDYGDDDDGNNDDEDGVCHGTGGSQNLGDFGVFQHPCQSHDNSFGKGNVQLFGHTFSGDHDGGDDSWGDGYHGFMPTAFETSDPSSSDFSDFSNSDSSDTSDSSDDADSSDYSSNSDDSGFASLFGRNENGGDTDQSSPDLSMMGARSESPFAGMTRMNGSSFGRSDF